MLASVLAAVGATPALSAAERTANVSKEKARIENERAAAEQRLNSQRGEVNARAAADSNKVAADADAFEVKLSEDLAKDANKALAPLFAAHREQPSRSTARALSSAIAKFNGRAEFELSAQLDHVILLTAFAKSLVADDPDLVSVFSDMASFFGEPIEAATALLKSGASPSATDTEAALARLEQALEHVARSAPRSPASEEHDLLFAALAKHATAAMRVRATSEVTQGLSAARDARYAASFRRVRVVHQDGHNGVAGHVPREPRIEYVGASVSNAVADDEVELDSVEHGGIDFARLT